MQRVELANTEQFVVASCKIGEPGTQAIEESFEAVVRRISLSAPPLEDQLMRHQTHVGAWRHRAERIGH